MWLVWQSFYQNSHCGYYNRGKLGNPYESIVGYGKQETYPIYSFVAASTVVHYKMGSWKWLTPNDPISKVTTNLLILTNCHRLIPVVQFWWISLENRLWLVTDTVIITWSRGDEGTLSIYPHRALEISYASMRLYALVNTSKYWFIKNVMVSL